MLFSWSKNGLVCRLCEEGRGEGKGLGGRAGEQNCYCLKRGGALGVGAGVSSMEEFEHGSWGNEDDDVEEVPGPLAMVVFHEGVVDVDKEVTAAPEVST